MSRVFMLFDLNKNVICANEAFYLTHDAKRPHGWGKMPPSLTKQFAVSEYMQF